MAGFLRFVAEPDEVGLRGALFLVNVIGEPVEFAFTRADIPGSSLWRQGETRKRAVAMLCRTLFGAPQRTPDLLFALASEFPARVLSEELEVLIPLARVAPSGDAAIHDAQHGPPEQHGNIVDLYWSGITPEPGSPARDLVEAFIGRGSLMEIFERAAHGLDEAYASA